MSNERRPHDPGRHLLGPHVVGQRVVLRRLVRGRTGPTGGPAMTDLLGECVGWSEGVAVVQPHEGPPVAVPIGDIVSGKPVPPRPSVRHRVSIAEAEELTTGLVPGVASADVAGWTVRTQEQPGARLRRRFNSCLALVPPTEDVATALAAVRGFYAARDRPAYLAVERDGDVERLAREHGWQVDPTGDSDFLLASLAQVRRGLATARPALRPEVELAVTGSRAVATAGTGCDPLAEGAARVAGDWIGLHGLVTDPAHRRRGLATAIVAELLDWGAELGARSAWLHVETDNVAARALYEGIGFTAHHGMRYLTAPD